MDALLKAAYAFLGYEGLRGADITAILEHAHKKGPFFKMPQIPPKAQQLLWEHILAKPAEFLLFCREHVQDLTDSEESFTDDFTDTKKKAGRFRGFRVTSRDSELIADVTDAQELGVFVVFGPHLRHIMLNVRDNQLQQGSTRLNDNCLLVLDSVARSRRDGALQSELAKQHEIAPRNFHYVAKHLCSRSLVSRVPVKTPAGNGAPAVSTNLLHLPDFAPPISLTSSQSFVHTGGTGEGSGFVVQDDAAQFKQITSQLHKLPKKMAGETELKMFLGYRNAPGHRIWRKLKETLVAKGYIEELEGQYDGKLVKMIRLVKKYDGKDAADDDDADDTMPSRGPGEGALTRYMTLQRAIMEMVVAGGTAGVRSDRVMQALNITSKVLNFHIKGLVKEFQLAVQSEQSGRSHVNRFIAPESLLAVATPLLKFSWQPELAEGLRPFVPTLPEELDSDDGGGAALENSEAEPSAPVDLTAVASGSGRRSAGGALEDAPGPAAARSGGSGPSGGQREGADDDEDEDDEDDDGEGQRVHGHQRRLSLVRQWRQELLRNHLKEHGFVLQMEVNRMFQVAQIKNGGEPTHIDNKTVKRLMATLQKSGDVSEIMTVAVPTQKSSGTNMTGRKLPVYLGRNVEWNDDLQERVIEHIAVTDKQLRRESMRVKASSRPPAESLPDASELVGLLVPSVKPRKKKGPKQPTAADLEDEEPEWDDDDDEEEEEEDEEEGDESEGEPAAPAAAGIRGVARLPAGGAPAPARLAAPPQRLLAAGGSKRIGAPAGTLGAPRSDTAVFRDQAKPKRDLGIMVGQGLLPSKMARVEKMHRLLCAAVALSGGEPDPYLAQVQMRVYKPPIVGVDARQSVVLRTNVAVRATFAPPATETAQPTAADPNSSGVLVSPTQLFFALHFRDFLQIVGTVCSLDNLEEEKEANRRIGEYSDAELNDMLDDSAFKRFNNIVTTMVTMSLVTYCLVEGGDTSSTTTRARTLYFGRIEVPAALKDAYLPSLDEDGAPPPWLRLEPAPEDAVHSVTAVYDFRNPRAIDAYWGHLGHVRDNPNLKVQAAYRVTFPCSVVQEAARPSHAGLSRVPAHRAAERAAKEKDRLDRNLAIYKAMKAACDEGKPSGATAIELGLQYNCKPATISRIVRDTARSQNLLCPLTKRKRQDVEKEAARDDEDGDSDAREAPDEAPAREAPDDAPARAAPDDAPARADTDAPAPKKRKTAPKKAPVNDSAWVRAAKAAVGEALARKVDALAAARRVVHEFVGVLRTSAAWQQATKDRAAAVRLLLERAKVVTLPRTDPRGDDGSGDGGEGEDDDDDGNDGGDEDEDEILPRKKQTKKVIWGKAEIRTLARKWLQSQVVGGPACSVALVPWGRLEGMEHKPSALERRVQHLRTAPPNSTRLALFKKVEALAQDVFLLRVEDQKKSLFAAIERRLQALVAEAKGGAPPADPAPAAAAPDGESLAQYMHPDIRAVLRADELEAIIDAEDLSGVPHGELFTPRDERERELHHQLQAGMDEYVQLFQSTSGRNFRILKGAAELPALRAARPPPEVEDGEEPVPVRPARARAMTAAQAVVKRAKRAAAAAVEQAAAAPEALRDVPWGGLSKDDRHFNNMQSMPADWREVAAVQQLLGLLYRVHAAPAAPLDAQAVALLRTFSEFQLARAMNFLHEHHALLPAASTDLRVIIARPYIQALQAAQPVLPSRAEVALALRHVRAALFRPGRTSLSGETDGADFTAILEGAGAARPSAPPPEGARGRLEVAPRERAFGGVVAVVLTGLTAGHLHLDATPLDEPIGGSNAARHQLDQFGPAFSVQIEALLNASPHKQKVFSELLCGDPAPLVSSRDGNRLFGSAANRLDRTALYLPPPPPAVQVEPTAAAPSDFEPSTWLRPHTGGEGGAAVDVTPAAMLLEANAAQRRGCAAVGLPQALDALERNAQADAAAAGQLELTVSAVDQFLQSLPATGMTPVTMAAMCVRNPLGLAALNCVGNAIAVHSAACDPTLLLDARDVALARVTSFPSATFAAPPPNAQIPATANAAGAGPSGAPQLGSVAGSGGDVQMLPPEEGERAQPAARIGRTAQAQQSPAWAFEAADMKVRAVTALTAAAEVVRRSGRLRTQLLLNDVVYVSPKPCSAPPAASGPAAATADAAVHDNAGSAAAPAAAGSAVDGGASTSAAAAEPASRPAAPETGSNVDPGRLWLPWVQPTGELNEPLLRALLWRVVAMLRTSPGMPEVAIADGLKALLGGSAAHVLLQMMVRNGYARCMELPAHAGERDSPLKSTAGGLLPALFAPAHALTVLPLVKHYFCVSVNCLDLHNLQGSWA